jgi:hypothetical protein
MSLLLLGNLDRPESDSDEDYPPAVPLSHVHICTTPEALRQMAKFFLHVADGIDRFPDGPIHQHFGDFWNPALHWPQIEVHFDRATGMVPKE